MPDTESRAGEARLAREAGEVHGDLGVEALHGVGDVDPRVAVLAGAVVDVELLELLPLLGGQMCLHPPLVVGMGRGHHPAEKWEVTRGAGRSCPSGCAASLL